MRLFIADSYAHNMKKITVHFLTDNMAGMFIHCLPIGLFREFASRIYLFSVKVFYCELSER